MVRKISFFALLILALAAFGGLAYNEGEPLPPGATNPGTWIWVNDEWVQDEEFGMSWNSAPESSSGMSNVETHSFEIINHVSVAQWIEWTISGTRKDWRILRPGVYASDSVTATIRSNNDVIVEFWAEDPEYLEEGGVTRTIPKWFSFSQGDNANQAEANGWVRASDYNEEDPYTFVIADSAGLHAGLAYKIWERIEVVASNSSSDYEGSGNVTLRLANIKHWVNPETGTWWNDEGTGYLDPGHQGPN